MEWQPIETAPVDEVHVRGMWVHNALTGKRMYFARDCGYVDDNGEFVSCSGDDFGWSPNDYDFWAPIPEPPK